MYTIELIDWFGTEIRNTNPFRIKKAFQPNPEAPGTFLEMDGPFSTLYKEGFTNGANRSGAPLTADKLNLLNSVHSQLYSKFVEFWNTKMLAGAGDLPSIRRMEGGSRKKRQTRKLKRKA